LIDGHYKGTLTPAITSGDYNAATFNAGYAQSQPQTFSAKSSKTSTTRWIGHNSGDTTSDEYINVTKEKESLTLRDGDTTTFETDISKYKANNILSKIIIVGLPVNEVTKEGTHKLTGFNNSEVTPPQELPVSPNDAFLFLASKTTKPSSFKVPGKLNQYGSPTCIYGAIVGYDKDGNAAPFSQGLTATFYLKKKGGSAVTSTELQAVKGSESYPYFSSASEGEIKAGYAYQSFLPFKITATSTDGSTPSIAKLYIDHIKLSDGTTLANSYYALADINEESKGVDFIAQDTVGAITLTDASSLNNKSAGDDAEIKVKGTNGELSFGLRVLAYVSKTEGVKAVKIGNQGSSTAVTSPDTLTIPADKNDIATKDVAFFSTLSASSSTPLFFIFSGSDKKTNVIQRYASTLSTSPADPNDFPLSSISTEITDINTYLDAEGNHNTVGLAKGVITVNDMFSNAYGATGATLQESGISGAIYLPADDSTASAVKFPGASVKIDDNTVLVDYTLSSITADQDTGILKLTSGDGALSKQITMQIKAAQKVRLQNKFVPVPGISDTPVEVSLADQNGDAIAPITITSATATANKKDAAGHPIQVEVELEADNGTLYDIPANKTINLRTIVPQPVFTAALASDKTTMAINASTKNYGAATLLLTFEPDFEKPYVGDNTTGNCRVDFEVFDNQAVDLAATEVIIATSRGDDITDLLHRTNTLNDNGTKGTISFTGFPATGERATYSATIIAKDAWGNEREVLRLFSLECIDLPKNCISIDPSYGIKGETKTITITGKNTNFVQGSTLVTFSCPDNATVTKTEVKTSTELVITVELSGTPPQPTSVVATILPSFAQEQSPTTSTTTTTISGTDDSLKCDITVTTGSETITCNNDLAFEILSETPLPSKCVSISPASIETGKATDLVITGDATSFSDATPVSFGCKGIITVNSIKAKSATELTVNITANADEVSATTTCSLTVDNKLTCPELTVNPQGACVLKNISRKTARAGYFLPKVFLITIGSTGCTTFTGQSTVSFGTSSITAVPLFALKNTIFCLVTVSPRAPEGTYEVSVDGYTGEGITFTIKK
ncbi:MAG: hypothetical protein WCQ99_10300, partial [Pseudomonadota bacterium]